MNYKFLPVKPQTHTDFKILCTRQHKTFDEMLKELMALKNEKVR